MEFGKGSSSGKCLSIFPEVIGEDFPYLFLFLFWFKVQQKQVGKNLTEDFENHELFAGTSNEVNGNYSHGVC